MSEIVIVCGFGRCGSSLTMQMLSRGGYPTTGEWPAFEDERSDVGTFSSAWLLEQKGKAVKLLNPKLFNFPKADYKFIWLDRNPTEQAKSSLKLLRIMSNIRENKGDIESIANGYNKDRQENISHINKLTTSMDSGLMFVRFENLLINPRHEAVRMEKFLGVDLDIDAMEDALILRSIEAKEDMSIELSLIKNDPTKSVNRQHHDD